MRDPELSLILATVGRVDTLFRLFDSLTAQTESAFEVIVVDQNDDDRLIPVLAPYQTTLTVKHVRALRGLSRARTVGLSLARAGLVGFPDDDCWYDQDVVKKCLSFFASHPEISGLTGVSRDANGRESAGRFDQTSGPVNARNVFRRAVSISTFCRSDVARAVSGFDERLGLGAQTVWGSGEETDFILRCIKRGYPFYFDPSFVVRHPQVELPSVRDAKRRGRAYGRGYLRVLKQHDYPAPYLWQAALRPLAGAALALSRRQTRAAALSFWSSVGRIEELWS